MQEAHGGNEAVPAEKPFGVMLSGRIESKLGLEPSDHRRSKPKVDDEPAPAKRARLRRHSPRVSN